MSSPDRKNIMPWHPEELSAVMGETIPKTPPPALQLLKGAREKSQLQTGTREKSLFRKPPKTPPAETSTNHIDPAFDTSPWTSVHKEPSGTWDEGWTSNIMSKDVRRPPTVGRGGRPATTTTDKEGNGTESRDSTRSQLGKESYGEEE